MLRHGLYDGLRIYNTDSLKPYSTRYMDSSSPSSSSSLGRIERLGAAANEAKHVALEKHGRRVRFRRIDFDRQGLQLY
ncbi:unnamed protein product [Linum trigynum]|uniref:Uncharacterized protein n=1 Tax=Linum trigynum TaxID=586398 RepID=A0AAV2CT04_9ROSI